MNNLVNWMDRVAIRHHVVFVVAQPSGRPRPQKVGHLELLNKSLKLRQIKEEQIKKDASD